VPDAQADPRFVANPLVTGHPHIRFYAAYPLSTSQGYKLGTLCVLDSQPRTLTPLQEQALTVLATQVMTQIEMKMRMKELHATVIENQRMSRELMVSEERFRAFMDASPAAAFIKDEAGRMVYCNHSLTKKFGVNPEDWVGKTDYQIWPKRYARQYREADCQVLKGNNVVHFDDISPSLEGEKMTWSVYKFPFIDASGSKFVAGIAVDVTKERAVKRELRRSQMELQVANRKLRMLALTDPLTDLLNRRGFEEDLETEFAKARRSHIPLSLLMLDIDDFKSFNDRLGHIKGDEVLRKISRILRKCLRRNDIAARYGGEEFIAILPDTSSLEAAHIGERLCEAVAKSGWEGREITVSIGVSSLTLNTASPEEFVDAADGALRAAKQNGKNQVCQSLAEPGSAKVLVVPKRKEGHLLGTPRYGNSLSWPLLPDPAVS
jgi:diguanylate cyclase (GGDEF)-like protein/PAS domain S-box-containing protein